MDEQGERIFLLNARETDGRFLHLDARPVLLLGERLRNIGDREWPRDGMANLVVSAQGERDRELYGFRASYRDMYEVDLESVEAMAKTLRKIDRGLVKLNHEWGYAETYAQYLTRVAKILKIKRFGWVIGERQRSWTHDDHEHHIGDPADMTSWVARTVEKYQQVPA